MNAIGLSHRLLNRCGLPSKKIDDILLHVGGDRAQYEVIKSLISRMAKQEVAYSHPEKAFHSHANDDDEDYDDSTPEWWWSAYDYADGDWEHDAEHGWFITVDQFTYYDAYDNWALWTEDDCVWYTDVEAAWGMGRKGKGKG